MALLVKVDLETAKEYAGNVVTAKVGNKKHQVLFWVETDDFTLVDAVAEEEKDRNILFLSYTGTQNHLRMFAESLNKDWVKPEYFSLVQEVELGGDLIVDDVNKIMSEYQPWVTVVIKVPDNYYDMRMIQYFCRVYPNIRFIGGKFCNVEGVRLGYYDNKMLDRLDIKYTPKLTMDSDYTGALQVEKLENLELVATPLKEAKKLGATKKVAKPSKKNSRTMRFSELLNMGGSVAL